MLQTLYSFSAYLRKFDMILLLVVLVELFLGGNGYLLEIGGIRLRVLLCAICMLRVSVAICFSKEKEIPNIIKWLTYSFVAILALGITVSLLKGNALGDIQQYIKGQLYFFMILFFAITIKTSEDVRLVSKTIVTCGIFQAFFFLSLLALMYLDVISSSYVYTTLKKSSEVIFRQQDFFGFLYKGLFHVAIAFFFILFYQKRNKWMLSIFLMLPLALSLTRGIMLGIIVTFIVGALLVREKRKIIMGLIVIPIGLFVQSMGLKIENERIRIQYKKIKIEKAKEALLENQKRGLLKNKKMSAPGAIHKNGLMFINASYQNISQGIESDLDKELEELPDIFISPQFEKQLQHSEEGGTFTRLQDRIRIRDFLIVYNQLSPAMILWGEGLGSPIGKKQRIEVVFVEILFKQGILGLIFWFSVIFLNSFLFFKIPSNRRLKFVPFALAPVFIYTVAATNNILTGSIGMSVIQICIVSLIAILRESNHTFKFLKT
jgi:hypothetical protein